VFVTETIEDAHLAARTVVRGCPSVVAAAAYANGNGDDSRNGSTDDVTDDANLQKYSLVVPVGGDGTLSGWINTMVDEILLFHKLEHDFEDDRYEEDGTSKEGTTSSNETCATPVMSVEKALEQMPLVGYIPMGTGNGLGYVIGCKVNNSEEREGAKKSIVSRLNVLSYMKQRKLERARRVMVKLKEVGDAVQEAEQQQQRRTNQQEEKGQQKLDIANAVAGKCSIVEMPLMEVTHPSDDDDDVPTSTTTSPTTPTPDEEKGDLCFFGGAGFDSLMLHDFQQIKAWSKSSKSAPAFVKDALSSVAGYCVALVARTLPQALRHGTHRIHVEVTTEDEGTLWVDHRRGDFSELAVPKGGGGGSGDGSGSETTESSSLTSSPRKHLIYSGTTGIIAAATTPYYGGGMRLFPYARLFPEKLQLRLGRISPLTGFFNIPSIFEGSYREKGERTFGCLDFVGKDFEVEVRSARYEEYVRKRVERKKRRRRGIFGGGGGGGGNNEDGSNGKKQKVSKGFPFQHSGESMGVKERFRLRVVQEPVKFVSFLHPRIVVDD